MILPLLAIGGLGLFAYLALKDKRNTTCTDDWLRDADKIAEWATNMGMDIRFGDPVGGYDASKFSKPTLLVRTPPSEWLFYIPEKGEWKEVPGLRIEYCTHRAYQG